MPSERRRVWEQAEKKPTFSTSIAAAGECGGANTFGTTVLGSGLTGGCFAKSLGIGTFEIVLNLENQSGCIASIASRISDRPIRA
jgi:hypothetical protein